MGILNEISQMGIPESGLWIAEAEFGNSYVSPYCQSTKSGSNVLEVGCGSGILLSMLAEEFADLKFDGLEPFGDGFSSLTTLNKIVKDSGVNIFNEGYETFLTKKKYELIYCVNVFEHLADWRHFLIWASDLLSENGKLVVLCPNYSFPYESHFRLPIIFTKNITYKCFGKFVKKFENDNGSVGLWKSLNFVKKSNVFKFIRLSQKDIRLRVFDDVTIIDDMISRVTVDVEFRKRQRFIGRIAIFLQKTGVLKVIKIFSNYLPYMKLEFIKY